MDVILRKKLQRKKDLIISPLSNNNSSLKITTKKSLKSKWANLKSEHLFSLKISKVKDCWSTITIFKFWNTEFLLKIYQRIFFFVPNKFTCLSNTSIYSVFSISYDPMTKFWSIQNSVDHAFRICFPKPPWMIKQSVIMQLKF